MERLTEREPYWLGEEFWTSAKEPVEEEIDKVYEKLKYYEDLEEQGKLLKLPCKVGDIAYSYCGEFGILEYKVSEIIIDEQVIFSCAAYSADGDFIDEIDPNISEFGKTVFLSYEEAEIALAKK